MRWMPDDGPTSPVPALGRRILPARFLRLSSPACCARNSAQRPGHHDAPRHGRIVNGFGAGDAAVRALEAGADTLLMPVTPMSPFKAVVAAVTSGPPQPPSHSGKCRQEFSPPRKRSVSNGPALPTSKPSATCWTSHRRRSRAGNCRSRRHSGPQTPAAWCFGRTRLAPATSLMTEALFGEGQAFTQKCGSTFRALCWRRLDPTMSRSDMTKPCRSCRSATRLWWRHFHGHFRMDQSGLKWRTGAGARSFAERQQAVAPDRAWAIRTAAQLSERPRPIWRRSVRVPSGDCPAKALWGEIEIRGKLPVLIPGEAKIGDGTSVAIARSVVTAAGE